MTTAFPFAPAPTQKPSPIDASGDNLIGIIGLASAGLGTVLCLSATTAAFGAPLVQAGFILGVVGLFPQGAKKVWPAAALITAILGSALSIALVERHVASQFGESSNFAELEQQLEQQLEQLEQFDRGYSSLGTDPYGSSLSAQDPLSGAGAPNGWPTPQR